MGGPARHGQDRRGAVLGSEPAPAGAQGATPEAARHPGRSPGGRADPGGYPGGGAGGAERFPRRLGGAHPGGTPGDAPAPDRAPEGLSHPRRTETALPRSDRLLHRLSPRQAAAREVRPPPRRPSMKTDPPPEYLQFIATDLADESSVLRLPNGA